jgi:uncharacterized protein (TIGR02118 family)
MGLLNRKADWPTEDFRRHWRDVHGPIAAQLPGLRSYLQHHVVDSAQRGISHKRGPETLDGISELVFDGDEAMTTAFGSSVVPALVQDERVFLDRVRIVTVTRREVITPDPVRESIKRMSLLRRRADVDPETFDREWRDEHARLVQLTPGVRGYRQNLVVDRQIVKGTSCSYEELPIDGIVELWFSDLGELNHAFASPEGTALMAHATTFIDEITTFMVETHTVL